MNSTTVAVTARVAHWCDSCHAGFRARWTDGATIRPGHRYLRHVAFRGELVDLAGHPVVSKECVSCACERGSNAGALDAGACSAFCHGMEPCARPSRHDGDCACLRCPSTTEREAADRG